MPISNVKSSYGSKGYLQLPDGMAMKVVGDGKFEEKVLNDIYNNSSESLKKDVIGSVFDARISMFIKDPMSTFWKSMDGSKCVLGNSWEIKSILMYPHGGYKLEANCTNAGIHYQSITVDTYERRIKLRLSGKSFFQTITASYSPNHYAAMESIHIKPRSICEEVETQIYTHLDKSS